MSARVPGYRGVLTMFFDGIVSMMNPYPKPWKVRVRRITQGWDGPVFAPQYALITMDASTGGGAAGTGDYPTSDRTIKAMNPAHIIYECLTNRFWGRGLDRAKIDEVTFLKAAQTLHSESFGLCLKWNQQTTIQGFIQSVLDTIGATLYTDRSTGKLALSLMRADYVFADLPVFDTSSGLLNISEATVSSPSNQISECVVTYHDPVTDKDRKVKAVNVAASMANPGAANQVTRDYKGVPTTELALRLAQRDLRMSSTALRRITITLDRRGWAINPGDVIRVRDLARNIPDSAFRVGRYEDGTLTNGQIKITAIQDVFALPATSFVGSTQNNWQSPNTRPCIGRYQAFEMPYALAVRSLSAADFNALTGDGALIATVMEEGQTLNLAYDVALKNGASANDEVPADQSYFCGYTP